MGNVTEEKWIEMLEKKADGNYIAKYPKVKSKSGVTFDEHLADNVKHSKVAIGEYVGNGLASRFINVGFTPKLVKVLSSDYNNTSLYIKSTSGGQRWAATSTGFGAMNKPSPAYGKLGIDGFYTGDRETCLGNVLGEEYYWEAIG